MKVIIAVCVMWAVSVNSEAPINSYGLPLKVSEVYGVPKIEVPAATYGLPEKHYPNAAPSVPVQVYGVPTEAPKPVQTYIHYSIPEAPQKEYGPPKAYQPAPVYAVPIVSTYHYKLEAPEEPAVVYGVPNKPQEVYGPPAVYSPPPTPAVVYGVPAAPASVYGVPN